MTAVLTAQAIQCRYPSLDAPVLNGVDLTVQPGESLAIVGASGSGKTTLLHALGTLLAPTAGTLQIHGVDPRTLSEDDLARLRNRSLGFLFQEHHLLPQCTALENTLLPAMAGFSDRAPHTFQDRAIALLKDLGIGERLHHCPGQLSGGERQRVALARALLMRPAILLADEPSGALDSEATQALLRQLRTLQKTEDAALVVVTHDPLVANAMDRVLLLEGGRLIARGAAL